MNGLFLAALEVEQFMRQQKWRFCLLKGDSDSLRRLETIREELK
jgi:hypothetical protein